jgi:hypothetical protein
MEYQWEFCSQPCVMNNAILSEEHQSHFEPCRLIGSIEARLGDPWYDREDGAVLHGGLPEQKMVSTTSMTDPIRPYP